ncbi:MAG: RNA polymerase sigma factor [Bacteroidales bacterium]|nr:RNA polymerase sigma factor [Bacteroidales bacterium]
MSGKEYNKCVDDYSEMLFKYFVKNISDKESAQDLTQDAFLALWKRHNEIEISKAKAFLFISAHNLMINYINYTKKQLIIKNDWSKKEIGFEEMAFENKNLVNHLIEKLPAVMKECIVLRDLQGFSYKQIAQITEMTEENVKINVFRARMQLKKILMSMK